MNKHNGSNAGKIVAGLATLAAAAAGAYFLYGKDGAKNRKAVKGWMLKMKGEILEKMEGLKDVSEETYYNVIDEVKDKYQKISSIAKEDLENVTDELRGHWKDIKKEIEPKADRVKKTTRKIKEVIEE